MKILLIIPTLRQGGAERVMSELANQWSSEKKNIHMVLLAKSKQFYELSESVKIHKLGFQNLGRTQKVFSEVKVFFRLRRLIKNEKPDYILSFMDKYNVFTILASRFLDVEVFVSDRSNPNKTISSSLFFLKKATYKYADGIIAQTELAKDVIESTYKNNNVEIIPNPIKEICLYPNIKRENIIINIGRLIPEKGQKYLLEAFSLIKDKSWKLIILGEGPLRKDLESQILRLGLRGQVYMPGSVSNIDKWLARASIFAFSSISEGFPNALLEAMVSGLPCVSFDCDTGPRDIIRNKENGFLIPLKNSVIMSVIFEELISKPDLRLKIGSEALKIKEKYDAKLISQKFLLFMSGKQ